MSETIPSPGPRLFRHAPTDENAVSRSRPEINTANNKIDLRDSEGDEQLDHSAIQTKNHNVKTDIPIDVEPTVNDKSSESDQSLTSNSAYEKNKFIANISGANNKKHSSESVSQSDSFKKNKD